MILDADALAELRSWVGDGDPDDRDLTARFARLGSTAAVAREVLRGRLAVMLTTPASLSIDGDYSENHADNIRALREQLSQLEALLSGDTTTDVVTTGQLVRDGGR